MSSTTLPLTRDASTVAEARLFVTARLREAGLDQLADAASLVTTELVTNVLVHTDSVPTVRIAIPSPDLVRVEVEDGCPALPVAGILDPLANSGRGLVLVEQLTQRWGVTRVPDTGKVIWFELVPGVPSTVEELTADQLLDLWAPDDGFVADRVPVPGLRTEPREPDRGDPIRRVQIQGVPTKLLNETKSHLDDLVRDLTLVNESALAGAADEELVDLAARLSHLAADLVSFRNQIRRSALEAIHRGAETLTLELDLPLTLRERLQDYRRALDEAEEHCIAERLLVPVAPPEQTQFRRWKLDRIIEQLGPTHH